MARVAVSSYSIFTKFSGQHANRDWQVHAACRSDDPTPENIRERAAIFFPELPKGRGADLKRRIQLLRVREICRSCPVIAECRAYKRDLGIEHGFWGELDDEELELRGIA